MIILPILFSSFFLTANAKTVNRQAYKVCKTNEEAYWNGSSAQCCDTTTHELVKNYVNGTGKAGYTCCSVKEDEGPNSGWTVAGAINGSCCSGWTNYSEVRYSIPDLTVIDTITSSRSIRQNGGVYYCATDLQTQEWYNDSLNMENESVYVSDSQWCYIQNGRYEYCYTSKSGNPSVTSAFSEQYCSYPNCP